MSGEGRWDLRRDRPMRLALALFTLCLLLQGAFWQHSHDRLPEMGIVPNVPGERTVRALSFGDEQAFFRLLALNIQNSGDTFGRFTALYKYDFNRLYHWFTLLTTLDNKSNYLPSMGTYYFSQTQNPDDVKYIVDFLEEYTFGRESEKWWWVAQAAYLAEHKLHDTERALRLADRLRGMRHIPMWAQHLPAVMYEKKGEYGEALVIIKEVLKDPSKYSQGELNFMKYFIDERLHKLKEMEKELKAIQAYKDKQKAAGVPEPVSPGLPADVGAPRL